MFASKSSNRLVRGITSFAFVAAFLVFTTTASAQITVNPGAGSYTTLKGAFDAINAGTHTGAVTVSITADTTETAPAVLNASGSGAASYSSVLIQPSGARTISGDIAGHLIDLNGANNVTINGLNSGANSLTISNISQQVSASTIRFTNDASNNTVTNSTVVGSTGAALSSGFGVIYFAGGTVTGNDNNTISNNTITAAGANLPINGIYSFGTSAAIDNSGNTISNNNISDFFNVNGITAGINVNSGSSTWIITGNRVFQTATRTYLTGNTHSGIQVLTGNGYTISNNVVGFANAGGTGVYAMTGTIATRFIAINLTAGIGTTSSVQGNTVAGITLGTSSGASTTTGIICGISITGSGNADVGTTTANTIGVTSGVDSIIATSTTTGGLVVGINSSTAGAVNIQNNLIGGLSSSGATAAVAGSVNGINISGIASALTIVNNTIGNATADNMRGGISGLTTGSSLVAGIALNSSSTGTIPITGNTIRNLTSFGSGVGSYSRGIFTATTTSTATTYLMTGNTIRDLKANSTLTGASSGVTAVAGIHQLAGVGSDISRNTIFNLANLNTGTGGYVVTGISLAGSTATTSLNTTCSRNSISNLSNAGTGTTTTAPPVIAGITIRSGNAATFVTNNFVTLGSGITTNTTIIGIWGNHGSTPNPIDNIYHNTINITGSAAAGALPSFGFLRGDFATAAKTPTVDIRNNIFSNSRSGGTGKHYAIAENFGATAPSTTGWGANASNYNVLFASAATVGYWGADQTFASWQTASASDTNSIASDPLLVSATDLHLTAISPARDIAFNLGSVTNDFDGDNRPGANALFDIGADEFDGIAPAPNDLKADSFVNPLNGSIRPLGVSFPIQASFTNVGTLAQTAVTVRYRILDAGLTEVYNQTAVIPSLASNTTTTVNFPNATIAVNGAYTIKAKAELVGDTVPANDEISGTLSIQSPLSGTYTVGSGGNYSSLTNAGGIFEALNNVGATSPIVINLTSDLSGELGTNALNEIAGGFTVLIKPSGAPRTITGSNAGALIRFNGTDRVTVDGSTTGATATGVGGNAALRELTIQNTNVGTGAAVMAFFSGVSGAQNDTVRNVNILGQDPTTTLIGLAFNGNTLGVVGTDNDNNRVENCSFKRSIYGIYTAGASTANPNQGTVITMNETSAVAGDRIRRIGMFIVNDNGGQFTLNSLSGISTTESADGIGIALGTQGVDTTGTTSGGITNALVARNKINGVSSLSATGFSAAGITVAGDVGGANTIANNMITGVTSPATSPDIVAGIFVVGATGSSTRLYYNSVANTGDRGVVTGQSPSFGVAITGTDPTVELKNNIFYTTQIASGGGVNAKSYAIGMVTTTFVNLDSNYNDFFSTGANDGGFRSGSLTAAAGTDYATVAAWGAAVADDANSITLGEVDPAFVDPLTNLHLKFSPVSPVLDKGIAVSVLDDFDGQIRSIIGLTDFAPLAGGVPDIGADELGVTTAAGVSVGGRVMAGEGRGLRGAVVTMTSMNGTTRNVVTGPYGMFRFDDVEPGQTYIVSIRSRRFMYSPQTVVVTDNIADLSFVAGQ